MKRIISSHNTKILNQDQDSNERTCNCRGKTTCILDGKCLLNNVVYQATVVTAQPNPEHHTYIGITSTAFKTRYANHKKSMTHEKYRTETELSELVWDLKNRNIEFEISWKIIDRANPFSPVTKVCNLCNLEKYYLIFYPEMGSINTSDDKCPH